MAGPDPAIHRGACRILDGRLKGGHDELDEGCHSPL